MQPKRRRRRWWLALLLVGGLVGAALIASFGLSRPAGNPAEVRVTVPRGVTLDGLVDALGDSGLAPRPWVNSWALRLRGSLDTVRAGTHRMPGDAHAWEVAGLLAANSSVEPGVRLTIVDGMSVWQVAARLERLGIGTAKDFITLAADRGAAVKLGLPVGAKRPPRPDGVAATYLEGFLYPDTYFFDTGATQQQVVARVTGRFRRVWDKLKRQFSVDMALARTNYGLDELGLVTLASLVAKEAQDRTEGPKIAGVFLNRIREGMRFQTDPTLMYRPDRVGKPPSPRERRDRSNPYNTYAYDGLPPGPITSPGEAALRAALVPARHDYIFFAARRDGSGRHAFARTLKEHDANIDRYLR